MKFFKESYVHKNISEDEHDRIFVIGDLHGYEDPTERLMEKLKIQEDDLVIFIGDYVDRGPSSKSVVNNLIQLQSMYKKTLFLKGNHEDMMLGSMGFPAVVNDINTWLSNGGSATLTSYGMDSDQILHLTSILDETERFQIMKEHIPESHIEFFLGLPLFIESENYFFCHAGVNPYTSINDGKWKANDLLWIRDHIYSDNISWEKVVVCGHTPLRDVLITERLICIDTGLYYYGRLSAINVKTKEIYQVERYEYR